MMAKKALVLSGTVAILKASKFLLEVANVFCKMVSVGWTTVGWIVLQEWFEKMLWMF